MPRELARKGIGWQARAVYTEAILYCRENLTDGIITRGELPFWMADMPVKLRSRYLADMVALGALLPHDQGWQFPDHVWRKWNPTKAQVDEKRAEEAQRKAEWRDRKRRMSRESPNGTDPGQVRHRDAIATTCPGQPEPEPEPEPEPSSSLTSSPCSPLLRDQSAEDDRNGEPVKISDYIAGGLR
jgi:hypothetical protein